jgi:hypothetical protein
LPPKVYSWAVEPFMREKFRQLSRGEREKILNKKLVQAQKDVMERNRNLDREFGIDETIHDQSINESISRKAEEIVESLLENESFDFSEEDEFEDFLDEHKAMDAASKKNYERFQAANQFDDPQLEDEDLDLVDDGQFGSELSQEALENAAQLRREVKDAVDKGLRQRLNYTT